jgi:hypothetical protein
MPSTGEPSSKMGTRDDAVKAMMPIPKPEGEGGLHLVPPDGVPHFEARLALLGQMSSQIRSIVLPAQTVDREQVVDELSVTNVQPIVLTQLEAKHTDLLARLGQEALTGPRTLLVVTGRDVTVQRGFRQITSQLHEIELQKLAELPWQTIGSHVCRLVMRNELPRELER